MDKAREKVFKDITYYIIGNIDEKVHIPRFRELSNSPVSRRTRGSRNFHMYSTRPIFFKADHPI